MLTLLLFLILLSVLVFVHEFGHFIVAKKSGIKVEEFGFGFPPRMWGIKKGETLYSINLIPLGGFVRVKGETGEHRDEPDSFAGKAAWKRFLVLVAGVAMNLVLAAFLLSIGFMVGLPTVIDGHLPSGARISNESMRVWSVVSASPADQAGIEQGDILLSFDGQTFATADAARTYIAEHGDQGITAKVQSADGQVKEVMVTSTDLPEMDVHGIGVGLVKTGLVSFPPHAALWQGLRATGVMTVEVLRAFGGMLSSLVREQRLNVDLSGPVGIAVMTGQAASMGFVYLLQFAAVLSINLAVVNLLPFPALDGGRILFLAIEKLRGRPVDKKIETAVHGLGFALLMLLVILVTYRDLVKFGGDIFGALKNVVGA